MNCRMEVKVMSSRHKGLILVLAVVSLSVLGAGRSGSNEAKNKLVAERVFSDIWGQGKVELIPQLFAPDYHDNYPGTTEPGPYGQEFLKQSVLGWRKGAPDLHFQFVDVLAKGDRVLVHWRAAGTQSGEMYGMPGSGKAVSLPGMTLFRFAKGRVAEEWTVFDRADLMRQIGALPAR